MTSDEKSTSINTNEKELSAENHPKGISYDSNVNVKTTDKHSSERNLQNDIPMADSNPEAPAKRGRKRSNSRKNRKDKKRRRSRRGKDNRKRSHHKHNRHKGSRHHKNSRH